LLCCLPCVALCVLTPAPRPSTPLPANSTGSVTTPLLDSIMNAAFLLAFDSPQPAQAIQAKPAASPSIFPPSPSPPPLALLPRAALLLRSQVSLFLDAWRQTYGHVKAMAPLVKAAGDTLANLKGRIFYIGDHPTIQAPTRPAAPAYAHAHVVALSFIPCFPLCVTMCTSICL